MINRVVIIFISIALFSACSLTPEPSLLETEQPRLHQSLLTNMVKVEGGTFMMGSDEEGAWEREKPSHPVTLDDFYIGKYEVTQDLFEAVMGYNESYFQCPDCPVNQISWLVANIFIDKLNEQTGLAFRLPTEAEWEYAARGGQLSKGFRFSGSDNIDDVAWYAGNANRRAHPVGQKAPNELGLYDMTGNMWELCQDDFDPRLYTEQARVNPMHKARPSGSGPTLTVTRGGGYEFDAEEVVVTRRDGVSKNVRMADIGLRLVLDKK